MEMIHKGLVNFPRVWWEIGDPCAVIRLWWTHMKINFGIWADGGIHFCFGHLVSYSINHRHPPKRIPYIWWVQTRPDQVKFYHSLSWFPICILYSGCPYSTLESRWRAENQSMYTSLLYEQFVGFSVYLFFQLYRFWERKTTNWTIILEQSQIYLTYLVVAGMWCMR